MKSNRWVEREGNAVLEAELIRECGISSLLARLMVNRNIKSVEEGRLFLQGTLGDLYDPNLLKDMDKAVDRIRRAVGSGERVVIYSDYDVDGMTGAAILFKALQVLGVTATHFVPNRLTDGYGINENAVVTLAKNHDLMISVDCGISDFIPINRAGELGLDVIVTDHHQVPSRLPPAWAVINPKREDDSYPFPALSGAGVAYKLAMALMESFGQAHKVREKWLDLVALGTIADVVPLCGENRILVKEGLNRLQETDNIGIRALKVVSAVNEGKIGVYEVGYLLAPRLNAASRLGRAEMAFALLTSDEEIECASIARELDALNNQRKNMEQNVLEEARLLLEKEPKGQNAVVLASDNWHSGVTGIVASRLKEALNCPVVLVAWDEHHQGKGTSRSIPGFPITAALAQCADLLTGYGGHDAAAGFSIERERWEDFKQSFLRLAQTEIQQDDLIKKIFFDEEIDLGNNAYDIIKEVRQLSPFGIQNPEPIFTSRDLKPVGTPREVGNNHLKLALKQGRCCYDAIGFKMAQFLPQLIAPAGEGRHMVDAAFSLRINNWKGRENIQLHLKDLIVHECNLSPKG